MIALMIFSSWYTHDIDSNQMHEKHVMEPPSPLLLRLLTDFGGDALSDNARKHPGDNVSAGNLPSELSELFGDVDSSVGKKAVNESGFLLGTDHLGRDVFIRIMAASNTYLEPCMKAVLIALSLGTLMGTLSGYFTHRWIGGLSAFMQDAIRSVPVFVGIIVVMAATKIHVDIIMIAFGILISPRIAGIIEQQIFTLRQNDFIVASIEMGLPVHKIILKHILLYSCMPILIAQAAFTYSEAVLVETSLSFLGIGAMGNDLSWGYMVKSGLPELIMRGNLWVSLFPTLAILISILGFQLLGSGMISFFRSKYHYNEL